MMKWIWVLMLLTGVSNTFASQQAQPLIRGSYQKIIKAHEGMPFIVALWSVSCTHCGADLEIFERLAKKYTGFNLVLISTDSPDQEATIVSSLNKYNLEPSKSKNMRATKIESWVFADSYSERLRYEIDAQWYGELPRTYFFDATGKASGVSGVLDEVKTEQWVKDH